MAPPNLPSRLIDCCLGRPCPFIPMKNTPNPAGFPSSGNLRSGTTPTLTQRRRSTLMGPWCPANLTRRVVDRPLLGDPHGVYTRLRLRHYSWPLAILTADLEATELEIGLSIPRVPDVPGLKRFVETAEALGFESVLAGDHIVLPTEGTNQYPYTSDGSFSRPSDEPFLETMTLLGFLAACTSRIKLGSTVIILPYRNPVVQA